jgi:osmotically-inducible protein OsmY
VTSVANRIEVDLAGDRSDDEIRADIESRLANDVLIDDLLVSVEVENGRVRLDGIVGSLTEKERAIGDAWVVGVTAVDGSDLELQWWARDTLRRPETLVPRRDAEIEDAVRDALIRDPRVSSFEPEIHVDAGTVTLFGEVDSLAARHAAGSDARNVVGVLRVKNRLKVRPLEAFLSDDIEAKVRRAFGRDPFLERWDIEVDAGFGQVVLSGTVNTSFEKTRAEIVAGEVAGVTQVINNLEPMYSWTWKPDREIESDINDQLWWSPFVDSDDVEVEVENGVATLSGEVDTWSEWDAATENAFEGGAKDVRNELDVNYPFYGPRGLFDAPMYPHGY